MVFPDTGQSTAEPGIVAGHVESGMPAPEAELEVPTVTLASIAREIGDCEVHWLKIDVEGREKEVLQDWDPATLRPWLVVVESTLPNSVRSNDAEWEGLLTGADYAHVYSDGLNRFYAAAAAAAAERAGELRPAFALPPNVFDDVQLGKNAFMCRELSQDFHEQLVALTTRYDAETKTRLGELAARYESALQQHELEIQRSQQEVSRVLESRAEVVAQLSNMRAAMEYLKRQWELAQHQLEQSDLRHQAMLGSLSWRFTSPLRRALDFLSLVGKLKSDPAAAIDLSPAQVVDHQPALSPGTRAWLARLDSSDQGGQP